MFLPKINVNTENTVAYLVDFVTVEFVEKSEIKNLYHSMIFFINSVRLPMRFCYLIM